MENVPQPANESYSEGDEVMVYISEDDTDSRYHGIEGTVTDILTDSLGEQTERALDSYNYRIDVDGDVIGTWFRHRDLVPLEDG